MAKKGLNLDDIMRGLHTVADLRLLLTGAEAVCLAKLVKYVVEHEDQFGDEKSTATGTTSDMCTTATCAGDFPVASSAVDPERFPNGYGNAWKGVLKAAA